MDDVIQPRVGGEAVQANVLHAVLVIVIREDHDEGRGAIGGGVIVTRNRVITAAHVVVDYQEVQVGFYQNSVVAANFRRADPSFVQTMTGFDPVTLFNDIAVLQFRGTPFPAANVIALTSVALPTGDASLASYGFTSPLDTQPSRLPLLAEHTVATCIAELNVTESHFCALASGVAYVCPGDNGSGLYSVAVDPEPAVLVS